MPRCLVKDALGIHPARLREGEVRAEAKLVLELGHPRVLWSTPGLLRLVPCLYRAPGTSGSPGMWVLLGDHAFGWLGRPGHPGRVILG